MLKDLKRDDWLSILNIPERRVPVVLLVRGTRNLKQWYQQSRQHFTNVVDVGAPNGVLDDVFIGDLGPYPVAYASVYGAPMASEVVHVFGVLGTRLVIQIGNCGALADDMVAGDLFSASEACCGDGASQYYIPGATLVAGSIDPRDWIASERAEEVAVRRGRVYTTSALFAEGADDLEAWYRAGASAVDLETAATFAVAQYFDMDRTSIVYVFDNPRQKQHILLSDADKAARRSRGNALMMELALDVVRTYGSRA